MSNLLEVSAAGLNYAGLVLQVRTVRIDGELISNTFPIVDASSESIPRRICEECYAASNGAIATCGDLDIAVRAHDQTVYWFAADREGASPLTSAAALSHIWSFPIADYETQFGGTASALPGFDPSDIRLILVRGAIYRPHLGLFTIPDLAGDPHGRQLLEVIEEASKSTDFAISPVPEQFRRVRIGLETKGIPETVLDVGVAGRQTAIRFRAHPSFPLWLTADDLHPVIESLAG